MNTLSKNILSIFLLLVLVTNKGFGQSLAIINNTYCKLEFNLGASMNTPCGDACYVHGEVPERTTLRWPNAETVTWNRAAAKFYWRNFSMPYEGAGVTGNCNNEPPFSNIFYISGCNTDVEYSWNVLEATGDIEVIINAVSLNIPPTVYKSLPFYRPKGGTAIIVNPMMHLNIADSKIEVSTNRSFVVGVYNRDGKPMKGVALSPRSRPAHYGACVFTSYIASVQQVAFNCFCSMEQMFYIKQETAGNDTVLVYTATEL